MEIPGRCDSSRSDPKLAAAVGLFVGFPGVMVALWIAVVAGGIIAIFLLALRIRNLQQAIPFGPFLAVGSVIAFIAGSELMAIYLDVSASLAGS